MFAGCNYVYCIYVYNDILTVLLPLNDCTCIDCAYWWLFHNPQELLGYKLDMQVTVYVVAVLEYIAADILKVSFGQGLLSV